MNSGTGKARPSSAKPALKFLCIEVQKRITSISLGSFTNLTLEKQHRAKSRNLQDSFQGVQPKTLKAES